MRVIDSVMRTCGFFGRPLRASDLSFCALIAGAGRLNFAPGPPSRWLIFTAGAEPGWRRAFSRGQRSRPRHWLTGTAMKSQCMVPRARSASATCRERAELVLLVVVAASPLRADYIELRGAHSRFEADSMGVSTTEQSRETFPHQDFDPRNLLGNFPRKKPIHTSPVRCRIFLHKMWPLPKNSGPNPRRFWIFGIGYLGPLETSPLAKS